MKQSYFRITLKRLKNLFVAFILLLILVLSWTIKWKSTQYIQAFKADQVNQLQTGIRALERECDQFLGWVQGDAFDFAEPEEREIFLQRALESSFHMLPIQAVGYEELLLNGESVQVGVKQSFEPIEISEGNYLWQGQWLWRVEELVFSDGRVGRLAIPITIESLKIILDELPKKGLEFAEVSSQPIQAKRTMLEPLRVSFSIPLGVEELAYLNVQYQLSELIIYFYSLGAIIFTYVLVFGYFFFRKELTTELGRTVTLAETFANEVDEVKAGDSEKRINEEFYQFFEPLPTSINSLLQVIAERDEARSSYVRELHELLAEVLEQKDPYTKGHSVRVAAYSKGIAKRIGCGDCEQIEYAALLHDVGKVAIPETILNKPGSLSDSEYDLIKTHPMKGFQLLSKSSHFTLLLPGVLFHHERLDGSGYPSGLVGDEIPLSARIIAVADVYDALTSDRSYRKKMDSKAALEWIVERRGILFDEVVVDGLKKELEGN